MPQAYTPGLKISQRQLLRLERRLPVKGEVFVKQGDRVKPETVLAGTDLPGPVEILNVANALAVDPGDVKKRMLKNEGEKVEKGEIIARQAGVFGLFKSECLSPISGTIETVSVATGKVTLRQHPLPVELPGFVEGEIESVIPGEGVILRTWGAYIQGIFGIGGETWGPLHVAASSSEEDLDSGKLSGELSGKIVVAGRRVTSGDLEKAKSLGIKAVISGGLDDRDLKEFLGYDLGVAITGSEETGITLVLTEGFGPIRMAEKTFNLLKSCEGRMTSVNGATQIRAGVVRPEIVIPFVEEGIPQTAEAGEETSRGLEVGSVVRIIREPHFGMLGKVTGLPSDLRLLETEARVRVVEVELENGAPWILPRANVEIVAEIGDTPQYLNFGNRVCP